MNSSDVNVTGHSLRSTAREILGTPKNTGMATLISQLFEIEDNPEKESAKFQYRFCYANFPNSLTLKLLSAYRSSYCSPDVRLQSLPLLLSLLTYFKNVRFFLSPIALHEIKPLLISTCRIHHETPESEFKILAGIVSHVAFHVFMSSNNNGWIELSECIVSIADYSIERAIFVFSCLPSLLDNQFLMLLLDKLFPAIVIRLLPRQQGGIEDWILGLEAGFNMAVQLVDSPRSDLSENILYAILKSVSVLVKEGKEETLREGFEAVAMKVREDAERYSRKKYEFVSSLLYKIGRMREIEKETMKVVRKIDQILREKLS